MCFSDFIPKKYPYMRTHITLSLFLGHALSIKYVPLFLRTTLVRTGTNMKTLFLGALMCYIWGRGYLIANHSLDDELRWGYSSYPLL